MQTGLNQYPEFHFLLIAPNLGAEWLFDAARVYWDRFRPTIINDFNFVALIPPDRTVTVTVIARRDTAARLGVELAQINPDAGFDPIVYDLFEQAKDALDERARLGQPFGVPIAQPTQTLDPNLPPIPTPRNFIPTRPPAGFITAAPPTPQDDSTDPAPIEPTPGSILGG